MRLFKTTFALLLTLALCGCGKPLPPEKVAYAGYWSAPSMNLHVTQEGSVDYQRVEGIRTTKVNAPIKAFEGNNMVVGVGPMSTTFVVSVPPHQVGTAWKMTVDGVELTRQP
jgi:hypothetical protein